MAKKPTYLAWSHLMGLRQRYSPKAEQQIKDHQRGASSPLGGKAVRAVPLAAALKQKGKPR
jgi:hypothetical protein